MKPILFSTPMVQAILDGRKTMTRRVIKPQPCQEATYFERFIETVDCNSEARFGNETSAAVCDRKPRYLPGDILWVRETWMSETEQGISTGGYIYKATDRPEPDGDIPLKWRPSIFMPREAARIFLHVIDVRVERAQKITQEDVIREGSFLDRCACMPHKNDRKPIDVMFKQEWCHIHGTEFKVLWDSLNAKRGYGWDVNPWVWVISFERISANEAGKRGVQNA